MSEEAQIQAAIRASLGIAEQDEIQAAIHASYDSPGSASNGSAASPIVLDDYEEDSNDDVESDDEEDHVKPAVSGLDAKRQRIAMACRAVVDL